MALEILAEGITALIDWAIYVLWFMILLEAYQFIRGGNEAGPLINPGSMDKFWKGVKARVPGTASRARRVQHREVNQYLLQQKEENDLDGLKHGAAEILTDLQAVHSQGEFANYKSMVALTDKIRQFGNTIRQTKQDFNKLIKRGDARVGNKLNQMFDYFKKKGIQVPQEILEMERQIYKLHQETAQEIASIEGLFREIVTSEAMKALETLDLKHFPNSYSPYTIEKNSDPFNESHLLFLKQKFGNEGFLLEDAYKKQIEAKKNMQGIILETRELYK